MAGPFIAIAMGDPAGIGPEIALKAVADDAVRAVCRPLLIGDAGVARFYIERYGLPVALNVVAVPGDAAFAAGAVDLINVSGVDVSALEPGTVRADCGRAALDSAGAAIDLALSGAVDSVVAAPHTQAAVAAAGVAFDGYPGFVAGRTGTPPDDVFLMLVSDARRIVHVTLHLALRDALDRIDRVRVFKTLRATDAALRGLGVARPRIAVGGVNPHAGEGGLFGREEIEIVRPAIAEANNAGVIAEGPFGADTMFLMEGFDAFVVMYHDQGHIAAKLAGFQETSAFTIGTPVWFATVAHGSAADIAGQGVADPSNLIGTILRMC